MYHLIHKAFTIYNFCACEIMFLLLLYHVFNLISVKIGEISKQLQMHMGFCHIYLHVSFLCPICDVRLVKSKRVFSIENVGLVIGQCTRRYSEYFTLTCK